MYTSVLCNRLVEQSKSVVEVFCLSTESQYEGDGFESNFKLERPSWRIRTGPSLRPPGPVNQVFYLLVIDQSYVKLCLSQLLNYDAKIHELSCGHSDGVNFHCAWLVGNTGSIIPNGGFSLWRLLFSGLYQIHLQ